MAGHSKWKNIARKKGATDQARAKVFSKLSREIIVAVRESGPNPAENPRLRDCIAKARQNSLPSDNIRRVIEKAAETYAAKETRITPQLMRELERVVLLKTVDRHWMDHIDAMDELRKGINLRAYAQTNPVVEYTREGKILTSSLIPIYNEAGAGNLGIVWEAVRYRTPRLSPPLALAKGAAESWKTFVRSVASLSLLFKGVDLTQAVSGPVRITYMVGDIAAQGFTQSFFAGLSSMISFLSLISIALCIMNLLPLPVLDGGMILLFLFEAIRRKPLPPRFIFAFQTVGVVLIAGLMLFAVFGDILYLANR